MRDLFMHLQEDKQCTFSPETGKAAHVLAASEQPHAIDTMTTLPIAHQKPVPAYVGGQAVHLQPRDRHSSPRAGCL